MRYRPIRATILTVLPATPRRVQRHLSRNPGQEYLVYSKVWPAGAMWDPSRKPGVNMFIYGPGVGTYRLDDGGMVHLTWKPRYGPEQHHVGQLLELKRRPKYIHAIIAGYLAALVLGSVLGVGLSHGSVSTRLDFGALGLFSAILGLWLLGLAIQVTRSVHRTRQGNEH